MTPSMFGKVLTMKRNGEHSIAVGRDVVFNPIGAMESCIQELLFLITFSINQTAVRATEPELMPGSVIYHGTRLRHLRSILERGICPRREDDLGNFPELPSLPGFTYFTQANALLYALEDLSSEGENIAVILEIDADYLDRRHIYPDEDYLTQVESSVQNLKIFSQRLRAERLDHGDAPPPSVIPAFTECAMALERDAQFIQTFGGDMNDCQGLWRASLSKLGNIAYNGIVPPTAIRRIAMINLTTVLPLVAEFAHCMKFDLGSMLFYKPLTVSMNKHIFDGSLLCSAWDDPNHLSSLSREHLKWVREMKKQMRQEHRKCVRVFTLNDVPSDLSETALFGPKGVRQYT